LTELILSNYSILNLRNLAYFINIKFAKVFQGFIYFSSKVTMMKTRVLHDY